MKRRNLIWLSDCAFIVGIFSILFTNQRIAEAIFGPSVAGGSIVSFYTTGLVLVSAGWVSQTWGRRIKALEEKIARLEKVD